MSTRTLIELIGAIIAIVMAVIGGLKYLWPWLRRHFARVDLQDPRRAVTKERLSWCDVSRGIGDTLLPFVQSFRPDIIFGINRGGAIVGGIIAKKLNIAQVFILDINFDRPTIPVEQRQDIALLGSRILLVDDARRTGAHMRAAEEYLRDQYRDKELRLMVILCLMVEEIGPEETPRITSVDRYAFFTNDGRVKLPWDL